MKSKLKELETEIFGEDRTDKEWKELDQKVEVAWKEATMEERQEFEDSGAGDMLGQIIEFMD